MIKKTLLIALMMLVATSTFAIEAEIGGLWYELIMKAKEAKVLKNKNDINYCGNIVILEKIEYEGTIYSVISIGDYAFCILHQPVLSHYPQQRDVHRSLCFL